MLSHYAVAIPKSELKLRLSTSRYPTRSNGILLRIIFFHCVLFCLSSILRGLIFSAASDPIIKLPELHRINYAAI